MKLCETCYDDIILVLEDGADIKKVVTAMLLYNTYVADAFPKDFIKQLEDIEEAKYNG